MREARERLGTFGDCKGVVGMAEKVDYSLVAEQLKELAEGDERWLPALSNAAALIWGQVSDTAFIRE